MSGFTRDSKHYGDRLVYEALLSKWNRYHGRCGCGEDWVRAHAEPAGFTVVREGGGFVALAGPQLTEGVDEARLTTDALWEVVTGEPGTQDWFETVHVTDRSEKAEAERKDANERANRQRRERRQASKTEPASPAQLRYLTSLVTTVSRDRFTDEFARAVKGSQVPPREPDEKAQQAMKRLTKTTARKLISGLLGQR